MIDDPTDYFIYAGYRKMMLSLLKSTALDLLRPAGTAKNDALIAAAREWVLYSPDRGLSSTGLTFADCIHALGEASNIDAYRTNFLARPAEALRAATQALDAINANEGVFKDGIAERKPELLTTGHLDASWLHLKQRTALQAQG